MIHIHSPVIEDTPSMAPEKLDSQRDTSRNIVSIVSEALRRAPEFPAFRPKHDTELQWDLVSSKQAAKHIAVAADHWSKSLSNEPGSVIGIWLTGKKYSDGINTLGLISAGYVPQLFSVVFSSHEVVWDLLVKSEASALVFDDTFAEVVSKYQILALPALTFTALEATTVGELYVAPVSYGDTAMIVHSSGTTSGMPKLIPCTHGWVKSFFVNTFGHLLRNSRGGSGPNAINTLGSLAHVGSFCLLCAAFYHGLCTVQTSSMGMSTDELVVMIKQFGVNRLVLYAPFLARHIRSARDNPEIIGLLQTCRQIIHTGVTLGADEENWAYDNGLQIMSIYGASETAELMMTRCGNAKGDRYLRMIPDTSAEMIPSTDIHDAGNGGRRFLEIVVRSGYMDSPHPSLISPDGFYHTGDLFEEVEPELYLFRGRGGDWVKSLGGFCDAKSIEDNVRSCCADIIHEAVVVGSNRPAPCLFLEIREDIPFDTAIEKERIVQTVIQRMAPFNQRLFPYERIDESIRIHMLAMNSLPRTKEKGNIRRNETEATYSSVLDTIFADHQV
ncbi:acetyl-CoA synthetase-like protein [Collybia nuda]|uniref:Acetyl-CoA synthetase-like protein n=1 Tax=Collybia nuda TaxID=64659 RepID=A0A9P5Y5F5_9AGAR|nr:acetyl-CoA synthetase-like protein [Collybia nuda]